MNAPTPHTTLHRMADLLQPSAIRAAATLRVAEHIAAGAVRAEDVALRTATKPAVMDVFLRYLTSLELLRRNEDGSYAVAELGTPLLDDSPTGLRQRLSADNLFARADLALVDIAHTVRTGEPAHFATYGCGYWESVNADPAFVESLAQQDPAGGLACDGELVIEGYDWSGVESVVDVGGHTGTVLIELLRRHPHLSGRLLDLDNAAKVAADRFVENGLADRCEAVAGSFFDPLPAGADVYLLSAILADWADEQAGAILRRCREAAGTKGKVLLADVNMAVPGDPVAVAPAQLWLRATMPAPVRTVAELTELAAAAGLSLTWEGPATATRTLLEFTPTAA